MKIIILAGGLGTRISEEANGSNKPKAITLAFDEYIRNAKLQSIYNRKWL